MAGLAHPQGERLLATAAGQCSIIQMVRLLSLSMFRRVICIR